MTKHFIELRRGVVIRARRGVFVVNPYASLSNRSTLDSVFDGDSSDVMQSDRTPGVMILRSRNAIQITFVHRISYYLNCAVKYRGLFIPVKHVP